MQPSLNLGSVGKDCLTRIFSCTELKDVTNSSRVNKQSAVAARESRIQLFGKALASIQDTLISKKFQSERAVISLKPDEDVNAQVEEALFKIAENVAKITYATVLADIKSNKSIPNPNYAEEYAKWEKRHDQWNNLGMPYRDIRAWDKYRWDWSEGNEKYTEKSGNQEKTIGKIISDAFATQTKLIQGLALFVELRVFDLRQYEYTPIYCRIEGVKNFVNRLITERKLDFALMVANSATEYNENFRSKLLLKVSLAYFQSNKISQGLAVLQKVKIDKFVIEDIRNVVTVLASSDKHEKEGINYIDTIKSINPLAALNITAAAAVSCVEKDNYERAFRLLERWGSVSQLQEAYEKSPREATTFRQVLSGSLDVYNIPIALGEVLSALLFENKFEKVLSYLNCQDPTNASQFQKDCIEWINEKIKRRYEGMEDRKAFLSKFPVCPLRNYLCSLYQITIEPPAESQRTTSTVGVGSQTSSATPSNTVNATSRVQAQPAFRASKVSSGKALVSQLWQTSWAFCIFSILTIGILPLLTFIYGSLKSKL